MTDRDKAIRRAAELLERQANALRNAHMQYDGHAYVWPRSLRAMKRLHDEALNHAARLRELLR